MSKFIGNRAIAPRSVERYLGQIALVLAAQFAAGKLGDVLQSLNKGGIGPVWPAAGVAVGALLLCGYSVWPGIAAGTFLLGFFCPIPHWAAVLYAAGTTLAALLAAFLLRRVAKFDQSLSRLRDALALIVFGAFVGGAVSASLGVSTLHAAQVSGWSGFWPAWLIYWLGDSTGVLVVTPLLLTLPAVFRIRDRNRLIELAVLLLALTAVCIILFGDLPLSPVSLHVLAFAAFPFVMWAAIRFGIGATALSISLVATITTLETASGSGPFTQGGPFINSVLLGLFFVVLSASGIILAALIAERQQFVHQQAAMEARLRVAAIVESSEDAIASGTLDGTIASWNPGAQRIYGYTEAEAVGKPISMLVPPDRLDEEKEILETLKAGGRIENLETMRVTKAGKRINVSLGISPIKDSSGKTVGISGIARDITERKLAEEKLRDMARKLVEAQEQERSRIGRELHDDINQRLALLSIELEQLRENPSQIQKRVQELRKSVGELSNDVQALSHDLHSSKLEYLGVAAGMKSWCREFAERQRMEIDFKDTVRSVFPFEVGLPLFRVLQEALHNASKYSGARRVEVELQEESGQIHLLISDPGKGFDLGQAFQGKGLGLTSMQERVRLLNGTISIRSRLMGGTKIKVQVPLEPRHASQRAAG